MLRPAKTPSGKEVASHVRGLIRRIRRHWPETRILLRGDGHYARPKVMAFCEDEGRIDYLFGLSVNTALRRDPVITATADECAVVRAEKALSVHWTHCETRYAVASWKENARRVIARIEAITLGIDIRAVVTSLTGSTPERLYEFDYCARG